MREFIFLRGFKPIDLNDSKIILKFNEDFDSLSYFISTSELPNSNTEMIHLGNGNYAVGRTTWNEMKFNILESIESITPSHISDFFHNRIYGNPDLINHQTTIELKVVSQTGDIFFKWIMSGIITSFYTTYNPENFLPQYIMKFIPNLVSKIDV